MNKMIPLKDLITQLQEMENKSPGVNCVINDNEWGMSAPKVRLEKVLTDENGHLVSIGEEELQSIKLVIAQFEGKSVSEMWNEMDKSEYVLYGSFEIFETEMQSTLKHFKKRLEDYNCAEWTIVLSI